MVRVLVSEFEADMSIQDNEGKTALMLAEHDTIVHALLLEYQCAVDTSDSNECAGGSMGLVTSLHVAAWCGRVTMAQSLIRKFGCAVNVKNKSGQTPLHNACREGHLDMVRVLVLKFKADTTIQDGKGKTALMLAAGAGHDNIALTLLSEHRYPVNACDRDGYTVLHYACAGGSIGLVRILINECHCDVIVQGKKDTSLHIAAWYGRVTIAQALINEFGCAVNVKNSRGQSPLHYACWEGHLDMVRVLVSKFKADITIQDRTSQMALMLAARRGHDNVVHALLAEYLLSVQDLALLFNEVCAQDYVDLARILISNYYLYESIELIEPLHVAIKYRRIAIAKAVVNVVGSANIKSSFLGSTPLHHACEEGHLDMVTVLVSEFKADMTIQDGNGRTALMLAARAGNEKVVHALLAEYQCPVDACDRNGYTVLHHACAGGSVKIVRALINKCNLDVNAETLFKPIQVAMDHRKKDIVLALINDFDCNVNIMNSNGTLLHSACIEGSIAIVRAILNASTANINVRDSSGNTPLHIAVSRGYKAVALMLMEFGGDVNIKQETVEQSILCRTGNNWLLQSLIEHNATANSNAPAHEELQEVGKDEALLALLKGCDSNIEYRRWTLLHCACARGNVSLVETLIEKYNCDTNARDGINNTPLHVAALKGHTQVVLTLINKFTCDPNVRGHLGRSLLHMACATCHNNELIEVVGKYVSPLVVDDNGDTPLHIACSSARYTSLHHVKEVLKLNPPILLRNNLGKTPRDMIDYNESGVSFAKRQFDEYTKINKSEIYTELEKIARQKYSKAERITRIFVIGNPGAGKSSLIESLKREGFLESFKRVTESSVPPHTAGIVPSIHTSKHYGRVLFYDFAGDPEYYSSHAAILENLVSSKTGDNLFIIVTDLQEDSATTKKSVYYWLSFILHLKFPAKKPFLILVGSHKDDLTKESVNKKKKELYQFCGPIKGISNKVRLFIIDCRNPKSRQMVDIKSKITNLIKKSPNHKLSLSASVLLGLLENDFRNEPAFSIMSLRSHIEQTGLPLHQSLLSVVCELHDLGLLFIVNSSSSNDDFHIIFNMSKLTNEVHRLLFSNEAKTTLKESCIESEGSTSSFNIGIIPQGILEKALPPNIPKECLIQLQYCQQISNRDVGAFPSLTESTSQSFLFFPALCSVDKSDMSWATPPGLSYSIGWLARCTDLQDYFPPRFLHVFLLRLVFRFALSIPTQNHSPAQDQPPAQDLPTTQELTPTQEQPPAQDLAPAQDQLPTQEQATSENQPPSASYDNSYFQRRCTMWKTGVHWLMREGVECMVELVNNNREVVIITKCKESDEELKENCVNIFSRVVSCFMEAKADFCHSTRLQFFLLSSSEGNYLSEDNLLNVIEVQSALLASTQREKVVVSTNGKSLLERAKILPLRALTLWHCIFPVNFVTVLHLLHGIVRGLYTLGLYLGISKGALNAIEDNFPTDVERRKRELVKVWLSSSQDPPCWWHLVQALKETEERALAEKIQSEHSVSVQLQEKLLAPQYRDLKPDEDFLESFAGVVGSKWPSLASSLSLSSEEIEEARKSRQGGTLIMLKKWSSREDATYGNLCEKLKAISLCGL